MAILTPSVIARESLMILTNELVIGNLVFRGDATNFTGAKVGDTITIRKPADFRVDEFAGSISTQNVNETSVNLTLEKHFDISVTLSTKEMTLNLDSFSEQVIRPAMNALAEKVDSYIYSKYVEVNQVIGTAGSPATDLAALANVDAQLMTFKVPMAGRKAILDPVGKAKFMAIPEVARSDYRGDGGTALENARMGKIVGIDWYAAQAVAKHTPGVPGGAPKAQAAAPATVGTSTAVSVSAGGAAGTYKKGDVVTFAGITGSYVVTADLTLDGTGAGVLNVAPQVPVAIPSNTAITLIGAHTANLVGNFRGLSFASVPLELPMENGTAAVMNANGLSVRVVYQYNASSKAQVISFDTLLGAKVTDPRLLARLLG